MPRRDGLDEEADRRGQVGAAEGREQVDRVRRAARGPRQRGGDHVPLAGPAVVVDAGAAAGDLVGGQAERRRDQGGGRGGVADPEVAGHQQLGAVVDELAGEGRAQVERLHGLGPREGVLEVDRAGPPAHLARGDRRRAGPRGRRRRRRRGRSRRHRARGPAPRRRLDRRRSCGPSPR